MLWPDPDDLAGYIGPCAQRNLTFKACRALWRQTVVKQRCAFRDFASNVRQLRTARLARGEFIVQPMRCSATRVTRAPNAASGAQNGRPHGRGAANMSSELSKTLRDLTAGTAGGCAGIVVGHVRHSI